MKSDYQVVLSAFVVIVVLLVSFFVIDKCVGSRHNEEQMVEVRDTFSTPNTHNTSNTPKSAYSSEPREAHLQPFDPNTADEAQLKDLGLSDFSVYCLLRYREKGGIFRRKENLAKIYGLTHEQYEQLEPYIRIAPEYKNAPYN